MDDIKEDAPANAVAQGGVSLPPTAKFKKKRRDNSLGKEIPMTDRRHSLKKQPVLLKRFRSYVKDKHK